MVVLSIGVLKVAEKPGMRICVCLCCYLYSQLLFSLSVGLVMLFIIVE